MIYRKDSIFIIHHFVCFLSYFYISFRNSHSVSPAKINESVTVFCLFKKYYTEKPKICFSLKKNTTNCGSDFHQSFVKLDMRCCGHFVNFPCGSTCTLSKPNCVMWEMCVILNHSVLWDMTVRPLTLIQ